jgi:hypothetical protein
MKKYYWCHQESESIGACNTEQELHELMKQPLIEQIDEDEYLGLKTHGWNE